jgi:hypothetical protein
MGNQIFSSVGRIITDHERIIMDIKRNRNQARYFVESHLFILFCTLVYGAALGTYVEGNQILINSIKIPLLFFVTLYISFPIFYILNLLTGTRMNFIQTLLLLVTGYSVAALVLLAFTPLMLFFLISAKGYGFTVFLTLGVNALAGWFGIVYIFKNYAGYHGAKNRKWLPSFLIGSFIIAFTGSQLGWALRPYFHSYGSFVRPVSSNFYMAMTSAAIKYPGTAAVFALLFGFFAFIVTLIIAVKSAPQLFDLKTVKVDKGGPDPPKGIVQPYYYYNPGYPYIPPPAPVEHEETKRQKKVPGAV